MRAIQIEVERIPFIHVLSCTISKKLNAHGKAKVVGIIDEEDEHRCLAFGQSEDYISIFAVDEDKNKRCVFVGFVDDMEIEAGDVKTLTLYLVTGTRKLDLKSRTRTFQNVGMTVAQVLQSNDNENQDIHAKGIFLKSGSSAIGSLVVQYKETDWDFAIRMASRNHTFIRPDYTKKGACYYFGLLEGQANGSKVVEKQHFRVAKSVDEYEKKKKEGLTGLSPQDALYYTFDSREIFEIGDSVDLNVGRELYVSNVQSRYIGEELVNTYILRTKNALSFPIKYNMRLIGGSLQGKVISAKKDTIQINLDVDANYSDHGVKDFQYSTVYSSPDGTGWYCMPESGDTIRVYFPSEREEESYAISSVHLEVSNTPSTTGQTSNYPPARSDPSYKSFKNSAGKEIIFSPTSISIKNPDAGSIIIDDQNGITITSDYSIHMEAKEFIEVHSMTDSIEMKADEKVEFQQGDKTAIILDENVTMKGARLYLQEKPD